MQRPGQIHFISDMDINIPRASSSILRKEENDLKSLLKKVPPNDKKCAHTVN